MFILLPGIAFGYFVNLFGFSDDDGLEGLGYFLKF